MPVTTPPTLTPAPTSPDRSDRATFVGRAIALDNWTKNQNVPEMTAALANVFANATDAAASATSAATQAAIATLQANYAIAAGGAILWVSGTTYAINDARVSPLDSQTYRRKVAGAGTIDPRDDPTNWSRVILGGGTITYSGTFDRDSYNAFVNTSAAPTLPDLTTTSAGFGLVAPSNAGAVPSAFNTSDGWSVSTGFVAGTYRAIAPITRSTAHGMWGNVAHTPKALATIIGSGASAVLATVQMPSNVVVAMYSDGTNMYAVALNTATDTAGTPVLLGTCPTLTPFSAQAYQDTASTVVFGWSISTSVTGGFRACAASLSGVALTAGTAVSTAGNAGFLRVNTGFYLNGFLNSSGGGSISTVGVNGTVCTSVNTTIPAGIQGCPAGAIALTTTTALFAGAQASGTTGVSAAVITFGGTTSAPTATFGTVANGSGTPVNGSSSSGTQAGLIPFDTSRAFFMMLASGGGIHHCLISASGTTATVNAGTTDSTSTNSAAYIPQTFIAAHNAPVAVINSTNIGLASFRTTGPVVASYSGATSSVSAAQLGQSAGGRFYQDIAATNWYYVGSGTFNQFTASAGALTSVESIAGTPTAFYTATLNNRTVKYGATWFAWTLNAGVPVSANDGLYVASGAITFQGNIT